MAQRGSHVMAAGTWESYHAITTLLYRYAEYMDAADFDAVADLCEMAARRDPALAQLAAGGNVKIAACYPRAVKGLFHQCSADLSPTGAEILNMRVQPAADG